MAELLCRTGTDTLEWLEIRGTGGVPSAWPQVAAQAGFSLVLVGDQPEEAESWSASAVAGGIPGGMKATAPEVGVEISAVRPVDDSGTGFVEIASHSGADIDLSGWILTVSLRSAWSDALPQGIVLKAGGVWCWPRLPEAGNCRSLGIRPADGAGFSRTDSVFGRLPWLYLVTTIRTVCVPEAVARVRSWAPEVPSLMC